MNLEQKSKIDLLKDFITVQQGFMSQLYFCKKWDVPYIQFSKIAYIVELTEESCKERLFLESSKGIR